MTWRTPDPPPHPSAGGHHESGGWLLPNRCCWLQEFSSEFGVARELPALRSGDNT